MKRPLDPFLIACALSFLALRGGAGDPSPAAPAPTPTPTPKSAAPAPTVEDTKPGVKAVPSPSPQEDAVQRQLLNLPIPEGEPARGMKFPYRDLNGVLRMMLEADVALRVDQGHFEFDGMRISTFDAQGEPEITISMPKSALELATQIIRSDREVEVRRADFLLRGSNMEFDTRARKGHFEGRVNMIIYNRKDL